MRQLKSNRRRSGAGMTEYIIIVGLVALGLFAVVQKYGAKIDETIRGTTTKVDRDVTNGGGNGNGNGGVPPGSSPSNHRPVGGLDARRHCGYPGCTMTH